nr:uncharacterized protein LOC111998374 [Quercus suber]
MIYSLQKAISHISQNNLSVSDYFTNFKTLSDELMNCDPLPECSCGAMRILTEKFEKDCVMKFLMGLNENYAPIRTQVLMADLMPDLNKVCSMVLHEEMQKIIGSSSSEFEASALYSNAHTKYNSGNRYGNKKERPTSSHCGIQGHTIEKCYKLHGYPPGYKPKGKSSSANQVSNFTGNDQLVLSNSGSVATTGAMEHNVLKCPISQEQCQQLMFFLKSQTLDGSQARSSHQAANVVATSLHSQAMVQHPLMPNFTGKVITSSCTSTLDFSHSVFSSQRVNRLALSSKTWILDTGASDHFVHSITMLSSITSTIEAYVQLPNGETALVSHIGTVNITEHLILENVLVVPSFNFNLISISQLVKSLTCCFIFLGNMCFIQDLLHWKMIGLGREYHGLYILQDTATQCSSQPTSLFPCTASAVQTHP